MKLENKDRPMHHVPNFTNGLTKLEYVATQILTGLAAYHGPYASPHEAKRLALELLEKLDQK